MRKGIKTNELYDLISYRLPDKYTQRVVENVIKELKIVIIEELQRNGRINIEGLGVFRTEDYGGKDMVKGNFIEGHTIKAYVEKRKLIRFSPSSLFEDCVNGKIVTREGRASVSKYKNTKYIKKFESNGTEDKFSVDDLLNRKLGKEK